MIEDNTAILKLYQEAINELNDINLPVADLISDKTGWCINSFCVSSVDVEHQELTIQYFPDIDEDDKLESDDEGFYTKISFQEISKIELDEGISGNPLFMCIYC